MHEPKFGDVIREYRVLEFLRVNYEVLTFKVQHVKTGVHYALKLVDFATARPPSETLLGFVNEIRVLSSVQHPLFVEFVEAFADAKLQAVW